MKVLKVTARSAAFELDNDKIYSTDSFTVYLNGKPVKKETRNAFSLFALEPDTEYCVKADGQEVNIKTEKETGVFNVRDFNACGDGVHNDTAAFCAAIYCSGEGGTVFVPQGVYLLSPLFLKSGITLYLDRGATLKGVAEREAYPVLPALIKGRDGEINLGTWQGEEADCFASLITAYNQQNIKIVGEGVIDCNALAGDWYINHRVKRTAWRPRGMFFNRCKSVTVHGVKVINTPSWNIHPYFCNDVDILDVKLINTPSMPTTDGIDPDACDGVRIIGADISVGDDCIAIKSGTYDFAKKYRRPCKNVTVRNCIMREGHGGVVFGSELSGGIENVTVERCRFIGTDRGLRIKTRRGRGRIGVIDGIIFKDIIMTDVKVPFVVNMYYNMGDETGHTEYVYTTEKLPVDERTPYIGRFNFSNMTCTGVEYCAGAFYGLPEAPIGGVCLNGVSFSYKKDAQAGYPDMLEKNEKFRQAGLYFLFVKEVKLNGVNICDPEGEPVILNGVELFTEN